MLSLILDYWKTVAELTTPISEPQWTTENKIVSSNNYILRNFSNKRSSPDFPVLIIPPQAGHHSSIVDYGPKQSLVQVGLDTHASVYSLEWLPATFKRRNETIADFVQAVNDSVDIIGSPVSIIGTCQGGWLAAIYAALYPKKVSYLTLAGAPIDFLAGDGLIKSYAELFPMTFYEWLVTCGAGNMPGKFMLLGFKMLNPYERFIKDSIDLYFNIEDKFYLDRYRRFRNWYEYTQDIPGAFYLQVVRELFKENKLVKGELVIQGKKVDLANITCGVIVVYGTRDDITLPGQALAIREYVNCIEWPIDSGHIGIFQSRAACKDHWPSIYMASCCQKVS